VHVTQPAGSRDGSTHFFESASDALVGRVERRTANAAQ